MPEPKTPDISLTFKPLTKSRQADFEKLFGERGACGGCWCMLWRLKNAQFERQKGNQNKQAMKRLIQSGRVPGILAYDKKEPVGWCSVGPRSDFIRLENSKVLKKVDDQDVWSITCLFITKEYRRSGVSGRLLEEAAHYASKKGAKIVEGYPFDPKKEKMPDPFVWTGLFKTYRKVGFVEVARRSPTRPIVRFNCKK